MNYNRPVHRQIDDRKRDQSVIRQKDLGSKPVVLSNTIKFGKYKGYHLKDIPTNYLEWLISVSDDSVALKYCRELANRPNYKVGKK